MLLIVTNIPTPYRIPLFNAIHEAITLRGKQFKVVFAAPSYAFRKWKINDHEFKFSYQYLNCASSSKKENTRFSYRGLFTALSTHKPSVVVVSGFSIATFITIFGKIIWRYKLVIWGGTTENANKKIGVLKRIYRQLITYFIDEYVVYSTVAKEYILNIDSTAHNKKIAIAYNSVNVAEYYLPNITTNYTRYELLYVGDFTPRKQVHKLIAIACQLRELNINFNLTCIGSGDTFNDVNTLLLQNNLEEYITLKPHMQKADLIPQYHKAHVFLFPTSYDIWGLVVNEAMAAGLCVFSSIKAGATRDLIRNNETGFAVDFDKPNEVVIQLKEILTNPNLLTKIRRQGQQYLLQNISIDKASQVFITLLD